MVVFLNEDSTVRCQQEIADEGLEKELTPREKRMKDIKKISNIFGGIRGYITGFK